MRQKIEIREHYAKCFTTLRYYGVLALPYTENDTKDKKGAV